jgi:hypothetical protein
LTAIDTVTNLVELIKVDDKNPETIARKYAQYWLSHYPWLKRCVHDPGGEFTGPEFQTKHYWRTATSKMCVLAQRIRNLTLYVKECIKQ